MIYLQLFWEFFRIGLFAVGGGMATLPFLEQLSVRTGWYGPALITDMIAISESTPGPMGVNMATYVGFTSGGVLGGIVSTLGLIFPSILIILIIAKFLQKFRQSKVVDGVFYGLRAASVALITAALLQVAKIALMFREVALPESGVVKTELFYWPAILLAAVIFVLVKFTPLKKLHPICFIALAAVAGIIFQM